MATFEAPDEIRAQSEAVQENYPMEVPTESSQAVAEGTSVNRSSVSLVDAAITTSQQSASSSVMAAAAVSALSGMNRNKERAWNEASQQREDQGVTTVSQQSENSAVITNVAKIALRGRKRLLADALMTDDE